jgi:hypothetical protein
MDDCPDIRDVMTVDSFTATRTWEMGSLERETAYVTTQVSKVHMLMDFFVVNPSVLFEGKLYSVRTVNYTTITQKFISNVGDYKEQIRTLGYTVDVELHRTEGIGEIF